MSDAPPPPMSDEERARLRADLDDIVSEGRRKSLLAALATWVVPLIVLYCIAGLLFAKRVRRTLSGAWVFDWTDDPDLSFAIDIVPMVLIIAIAAWIVWGRRRR